MTNEENELLRLNARVAKIISTYCKRMFPNNKKLLSVVARTIREIDVGIDNTERTHGLAYFSNLGMGEIRVIYQNFFRMDDVQKISVLLHEYSHALNSYNMRTKFDFLEEGMSDVFSETLVNDWLFNQEGLKRIPKPIRNLYADGFVNYSYGYIEERQVAKDILLIFLHYYDSVDEAMANFITGNDNFYKLAGDINGINVQRLFQYIQDSIITTKYNNSNEFYDIVRIYTYGILEKTFKTYESGEILKKTRQPLNKMEGVCFSKNLGISIIYNVKQLEELLGPNFDYNNPTKATIDELKQKGGSLIYAVCNGGYIPEKLKIFIKAWFQKCNGNLKEFDYILSVLPNVPDELLVDILKTNPQANSDFIYDCIRKYEITKIDDYAFINGILEHDKTSKSKIEVEIFAIPYLRPQEKVDALIKIINEMDLKADYENIYTLAATIESVINLPVLPNNIPKLTDSLNKCRRFSPQESKNGSAGNIIRRSIVDKEDFFVQKIHDDFCIVFSALIKYGIVINSNEVLEKIKAKSLSATPLKFKVVPDEMKIIILKGVLEIFKNPELRYFVSDLKLYINTLYLDIKDQTVKKDFAYILNYDGYFNNPLEQEISENKVK